MNSEPVTQIELDRLVDDECDEATRYSLLQRVAASNCWEQLALAFLEDQAVRRAVRELCSESANSSQSSSGGVTPAGAPAESDCDARTKAARRRLSVTTIAAVVLLVVAVGNFALSTRNQNHTIVDWLFHSEQLAPAQHIVEQSDLPPLPSVGDELPASVKFVVNDGRADVPRVFDVPIQSDAPLLDITQWQPQSVLSQETRDWLASSGHEVEEAASLVPVTLSNGRSVAFPVHQVRLNYRGPQWHQ